LRKKSISIEHEYNLLKINVEKTKNEIDYINNEKEKTGTIGYADKIASFSKCISACEKKTKQLKSEMSNIERAVKGQVEKQIKES